MQPSKYRRISLMPTWKRELTDQILVSNLSYFLASLFGFYFRQYEIAMLCGCTWLSSAFYHYSREAMFFNIDCTFASSLVVIFGYTIFLSYENFVSVEQDIEKVIYLYVTVILMPLAIYFFKECGKASPSAR